MKILGHNILILSAGRRVSLLRGFKEALDNLNIPGQVFAADLNPELSAACAICDKAFYLPHILSEGYEAYLMNLCVSENIGLIIPTIDTELLSLSHLRERFDSRGIKIVVSSPDLISACRDKRKTRSLFASLGLLAPKLYPQNNLEYPCLVKPYDGSLSQGVKIIRSESDISDDILLNKKNIFCQYIDHNQHDEFTVDLYFDRKSKLKCVVPRKRLQVRGGEVAKALTEKNTIIPELFNTVASLPGAIGCLTFQLFRHHLKNEHWYIEINPRFGGGYPLSRLAGADFQTYLIREYFLNEDIDQFGDWRENTLMLRYDAEVISEYYS
jgi:carbamoyl-phosphate synthase large subunit